MPKVLATEIRVGDLLEWDKHLQKALKCYHVHVGGRGDAYMQVIECNPKVKGSAVTTSFK